MIMTTADSNFAALAMLFVTPLHGRNVTSVRLSHCQGHGLFYLRRVWVISESSSTEMHKLRPIQWHVHIFRVYHPPASAIWHTSILKQL